PSVRRLRPPAAGASRAAGASIPGAACLRRWRRSTRGGFSFPACRARPPAPPSLRSRPRRARGPRWSRGRSRLSPPASLPAESFPRELAHDRFRHGVGPFAVDGADFEPGTRPAQSAEDLLDARVGVFGRVRLVEHQPARLAVEGLLVLLQLRGYDFYILHRLLAREIDEVQEQPGAAEMAQELVAKARALRGAFDEPRDVGDDEARLAHAHHAERGVEGRERIVRDLRPRARDRADEGGLAGVRQAEKPDVSEHAQLEGELAHLAGLAAGELAGGAVDARLEVDVAQSPGAAAREQGARAVFREVGHQLAAFPVADERPYGHAQLDVAAGAAVAVRAHPARA